MSCFCIALFVISIMAVKRLNAENQFISPSDEMEMGIAPATSNDNNKKEPTPKLEPEIARLMPENMPENNANGLYNPPPAAAVVEPTAYPNPSPPDSESPAPVVAVTGAGGVGSGESDSEPPPAYATVMNNGGGGPVARSSSSSSSAASSGSAKSYDMPQN